MEESTVLIGPISKLVAWDKSGTSSQLFDICDKPLIDRDKYPFVINTQFCLVLIKGSSGCDSYHLTCSPNHGNRAGKSSLEEALEAWLAYLT